ncbi:MAG: site-specific integrase [Candidatus Eremiobacteraeota bacterium]|nr:site-specific integrase [Candidatus Eremiobacteraeota bacterium]
MIQRLKTLMLESGQVSNFKEGRLSLSEYLNGWLKDVAVQRRASTLATYDTMLRNHVVPYLGAVHVHKLTREAIRAWIVSLQKAKVGARALQLSFTLLNSALGTAEYNGVMNHNPCKGIPKPHYEAKERETLNADELRRLLTAARGSRYEAAIAIAVGTGARQAEILGLRWMHVNLDAAMLAIETQLQDGKSAKLKTKASKRNIPLPAFCVQALVNHRKRMQVEDYVKPGDFLFVGETHRPLDRHNFVRRAFKPLLREAGLPDVSFHELRHSWATLNSSWACLCGTSQLCSETPAPRLLWTYIPTRYQRLNDVAQRPSISFSWSPLRLYIGCT